MGRSLRPVPCELHLNVPDLCDPDGRDEVPDALAVDILKSKGM